MLDTRGPADGAATVDGQFLNDGIKTAGSMTQLTVAGRGNVPLNAAAVVLNVTVTQPTGGGFVTVWNCGVAPPNASTLNFVTGQTAPNLVVVKVETNQPGLVGLG
ncbi:MAG TPA: hypothetical protein PLV68_16895, partial [Ilumatobacteraceae bacterium]|nr:hypothetical protein [Ilumatobacteraceae bacterium]